MEILIAGAGKVGKALTKELGSEGHNITLIDSKAVVLEDAQTKYDVITYEGNAASQVALKESGVENMDVFIAATNADEVNMLACLTAHTLNPRIRTIARIRNPLYIDQAYQMSGAFGVDLVINPERTSASEIATQLKYPGFLKRETFAKARVQIVELKATRENKLADVMLKNIHNVLKSKILITAVLRDNQAYMPNGDIILRENDTVFVTGEPEQLHNMLKNIGVITKPVKHCVICGGGRISYYLAQQLEKSHITSTIIEIDPKKCDELACTLPNTTIINGDVSSQAVLDGEDIGEYDALVSCTGLDELNIVTSLYATANGIPNVVTKLGRGEDRKLINSLNIGSTVCPKDLITMHIVRYVRAIQNKEGAALTIHKIADGHAEVIEFSVDKDTKHIGEALKDLKIRRNVLIASIGSGTSTVIPNGNSSFKLGDTVIVVTNASSTIYQLNDIFEA